MNEATVRDEEYSYRMSHMLALIVQYTLISMAPKARAFSMDVRELALKAKRVEGLDLPLALDQIAGWQIARKKLPQCKSRR